MFLLAESVDGGWRPGIGDPTPMGWATVVAYLLAAVACGWAAVEDRRVGRRTGRGRPAFWWILAVLLLLLGINKQLDLQTWFTTVGRRVAREQGWYARRKEYQTALIKAIAAGGLLGLLLLGWCFR